MTDEYDERDRGVLTEADRKYLKNPDDYSRQASYQREDAIRNRIRNAVLDFQMLATDVDQRVYDELFGAERFGYENDDGDSVAGTNIPGDQLSIPFGVEFLIRLSLSDQTRFNHPTGLDRGFHELFSVERPLEPFVRDVEKGIQQFLNHHKKLTAEIEVNIESRHVKRINRLADELEARDEPVSGREAVDMAARLGRAGFSREEINELLGLEPTDEPAFRNVLVEPDTDDGGDSPDE
jgi:hypothetical protein